ncbi:MAG: gamma-glutamyltransferase family protein [Candidatus Zixiibacteriota bacterium]
MKSLSLIRFKGGIIIYTLFILILSAGLVFSQTITSGGEVVTGQNGMVSTAHPLASQAGLDMLKMGGNAIDAAVAAAFTIGVVEPDGSGIGGGGGMVVYLNETKQSYYINYYQQAPAKVEALNYNNSDRHTAKAILIPGTVAGLTLALEKFGTLPLAKVLEPAIKYAEDGFEIDATLAQILLDNVETVQGHESTANIFLDGGFPRMQGEILIQPELAETLKEIAHSGRDGFYSGKIAEKITSDILAGGGVVTIGDFKNYQARLEQPLHGTYRGYDILAANAPQSGCTIIQSLNMLENADMADMGNYATTAATLHLMAETFRRSYTDRWQYVGDPEYIRVPLNGILSKEFARERYMEINPFLAEPRLYRDTPYGNPAKYDLVQTDNSEQNLPVRKEVFNWEDNADDDDEGKSSYDSWGEDLFDSWGSKKDTKKVKKNIKESKSSDTTDSWIVEEEFDGHTTHLSIIDKDGNAVALTQTLGTFFGSGITSAGVLLNCGMANFSMTSAPNIPRPNMQPRSSISPTIILKDGQPRFIVGSPGASRIISTVVEIIVNIIDFKMNAFEANRAPRFYCQKFEDYLHIEQGISLDVQNKLKKMGHNLRVYEGLDLFFGGAQLILIDPETGVYYGSADVRRGGIAIGY